MFRKLLLCVLFMLMAVSCGQPYETSEAELFVMVTSDLHLSEKEQNSSVIPLSAYSVELARTAAREVIAEHPDVFILCGDNTNSGRESDEHILHDILYEVKEAGIRIILVPGNHDLNITDENTFRTVFCDLLQTDEEDPASLSYVSVVNNVMFLAADDSSFDEYNKGRFSDDTMEWIRRQLIRAEKAHRKVIFISHHNVLFDDGRGNYGIMNKELEALLKRYHVQLCLSGHTHQQDILEDDGLYEIVSGAPMSGTHPVGRLRIDGDQVTYDAQPLDFEAFSDIAPLVHTLDRSASEATEAMFRDIFLRKGYTEEEADAMTDTASLFLHYYGLGTLSEHKQEILDDPYCERMLEGLSDANYGPWMDSVLHSELRNAVSLSFEYR
ncbi:MAG: metallophosphoesterase [Solobacterium sp.]|nr:metallophosphoesterase [Solobacterium sp.]